jgi:MFS family permease
MAHPAPTIHPFHALLATQARRRMVVLVGTALLFNLFTSGIEVILPLWVTSALQLPEEAWAQLRMLRFTGVLVGVVVLGALSDRFGQRVLGAASMLGTAAVLVLLGLGYSQALWWSMPFYSALVSTAFVNMNTLTQQVSERRPGLANTLYRGVGAVTGIAAPLLATQLGARWGGYPPVFLVCAGLLVLAAGVLWLYPGETTPPPLGAPLAEVRRLWGMYAVALREAPLLRFILVSQLWGNVLAGLATFAAIRFTKELGFTHPQFGLLGMWAGGLTLLATLTVGINMRQLTVARACSH